MEGVCTNFIEWFELGGTLESHLVQIPCDEQGHQQLHQELRAPARLTSNEVFMAKRFSFVM